ncbi:single-stranded DNA-binding protein [Patescibacteria group bacterium]|nr:single-stranded DNA-binding protein [Patescibacteria group bacterium]
MASSLNKVMIIGNLTRDPELRQTTSGQSVCTLGVATNRYWNNQDGEKQEQTEYHNVVCWGKLAEICNQYLTKGKKVYFDGRLQTRDWEGQDGVRRYRTEIVAENMIMLDRGGAAGGSFTPPDIDASPEPLKNESPSEQPPDDEIKIEDIPF